VANAVHYVSYDGNGNVMGLVNAAAGTWSARYEYGPFGEVIRSTGPMAAANPFRWSTKIQDDDTGLNYYGYRYYSAAVGRWLGRDPIGERGGVGLHSYTRNKPTIRIDPLGLVETYPHWPPALPPSKPFYPPFPPNMVPPPSNPPDEVLPPIGEYTGFNVAFSAQTKYNTGADIRYECPKGEDGLPRCKNPKLAQIALVLPEFRLFYLAESFRGNTDWKIDAGPYWPFYGEPENEQTGSYGQTSIWDRPGFINPRGIDEMPGPFRAIYQLHQSFETCAVCTDDGPGKYWIIGCVNWGHSVGGSESMVSRWGNGFGQKPLPPSDDFKRLFPKDLLKPAP
jgi:RHS repeat-associated protein